MKKIQLLEHFEETNSAMYAGDVDEAIHLHFDLMMENYRRKPLFYKNLLKYDRYMVAVSLLSFYFTNSALPLSKVKSFCRERGYLSRNSLDSYFSFFFISGYMSVGSHSEDGRQREFKASEAAILEAKRIVKAYLLPSQIIQPDFRCLDGLSGSDDLLERYFNGFSQLLQADIMLDKLLPEAKWMINRDGGHLLMLALYTDALRNGMMGETYKASTYAELSFRLHVSKTHVIRMVKEGELLGYFKCHRNIVELRPAFITLVKKVMVICFATSRLSMELGDKRNIENCISAGVGILRNCRG